MASKCPRSKSDFSRLTLTQRHILGFVYPAPSEQPQVNHLNVSRGRNLLSQPHPLQAWSLMDL